MCYCDKNNVKLSVGDTIVKDGQKYTVRSIESYSCATVATVEHLITKVVEIFHLGDIIKL